MARRAIILFDFDGTIADTRPGIAFSVAAALGELGRPQLPPETVRRFVGPPLRESFEKYCGLPRDQAEHAVAAYRRHYAAGGMFMAQTYPGLEEALERFAAAGYTLAVATAKPEPFAVTVMEKLGLDDRFATIAGASFDGTLERKDDIIKVALGRIGVDTDPDRRREDTVMVGDRAYDVVGAARCAIPTIGAGWGYGSRAELIDAGAVRVIDTAGELPSAVDALLAATCAS